MNPEQLYFFRDELEKLAISPGLKRRAAAEAQHRLRGLMAATDKADSMTTNLMRHRARQHARFSGKPQKLVNKLDDRITKPKFVMRDNRELSKALRGNPSKLDRPEARQVAKRYQDFLSKPKMSGKEWKAYKAEHGVMSPGSPNKPKTNDTLLSGRELMTRYT